MMTCVSDRSGTASSGARDSAAMPNPAATSTPATVRMGRRAHALIRRSIIGASPLLRRRAQLALGRDQEVARRHDVVAEPESARHLVVAPRAPPQLDLARRQPAITQVHEHDVALS